MKFFKSIWLLLIVVLSLLLDGCGGSGSSSNPPLDNTIKSKTIPDDLLTASLFVDVDMDGDQDLIVGTQGSNRTRDIVLLNNGTGQFTELANALPIHYKSGLGSTVNLQNADINKNGIPDIIATTVDTTEGHFYETAQVQLWLGNGDGTFSDASSHITNSGVMSQWPEWIRIADFDNDGSPDFVLTVSGCPIDKCSGGVFYLNDGQGHFSEANVTTTDAERSYSGSRLEWESDLNTRSEYISSRYPLDLATTDLNGDGKTDIVAGLAGLPQSFLNQSTPGNLKFKIVYNVLHPNDVYNDDWIIYQNLVLMDFNGDGIEDLVAGPSISGTPAATAPVYFFEGKGNGVFALNTSIYSNTQPNTAHARQWLSADFNLDGFDDLFIADHGYDTWPFHGAPNLLMMSSNNGQLLQNQTATSLDTLSTYTHGAAIGDINGDGYPDLFLNTAQIRNGGSQFIADSDYRLWINNGNGTFSPNKTF